MSWTIGEPVTVVSLVMGGIAQGRVVKVSKAITPLGDQAEVQLGGARPADLRNWFIFATEEDTAWARGHGDAVAAALLLTRSA